MTQDFLSSLGYLALGSRMKRAGTILQSATQAWFREAGCDVPAGHMPLLAGLEEAGRVPLGTLAEMLGIAQPGVSRMVANLEAEGLVTSVAGEDDKRVRLLDLSPKARRIVEDGKRKWWPIVNETVAELCEDLSGPLTDQLAALEDKLAAGDYERLLNAKLEQRTHDDVDA